MNERENINTLRGDISRTLKVLARLESAFLDFLEKRLPEKPGTDEAMIIAQSLSNYYTCLETLFLRISQFFENNLEKDRWHQSLLDRMIIEVPDYRPAVISEKTHHRLVEILKFRHFTRYYFELDYDWDKLRYLTGKFHEVRTEIIKEITEFDVFLSRLAATQ
jgi:hypothetical protein